MVEVEADRRERSEFREFEDGITFDDAIFGDTFYVLPRDSLVENFSRPSILYFCFYLGFGIFGDFDLFLVCYSVGIRETEKRVEY